MAIEMAVMEFEAVSSGLRLADRSPVLARCLMNLTDCSVRPARVLKVTQCSPAGPTYGPTGLTDSDPSFWNSTSDLTDTTVKP